MTYRVHAYLLASTIFVSFLFGGSLQAEVTFTVSDDVPNGPTRVLSTNLGSVSAPAGLATMTYIVSNLDFTSVGGSASETVAYDITYSQTGGSAVQFNSFGNISVRGGADNNQVEPGETLTATLSLNNALTTFNTSLISLAFTEARIGGYDPFDESFDLTTSNGTTTVPIGGANVVPINPPSSFLTLATIDNPAKSNDAMNLSGFDVEVTVSIPETSALGHVGLGLFALFLLRCRR